MSSNNEPEMAFNDNIRTGIGKPVNRLEQLKDTIVKECPILYSQKNFGFECGSGWMDVLADLSYLLERYNYALKPYYLKITAAQVKEKFGTLRFYYDIDFKLPWHLRILPSWILNRVLDVKKINVLRKSTEVMADELIRNAEQECSKCCEICGTRFSTIVRPAGSWIRYICEPCAKSLKTSYYKNDVLHDKDGKPAKADKDSKKVNKRRTSKTKKDTEQL